MMKKLLALFCVVALCASMTMSAYAADTNPGTCQHDYNKVTTYTTYDKPSTTHHRKTDYKKKTCSRCGDVVTTVTSQGYEAHISKGTTYNYHNDSDGRHYFYLVCKHCNTRFSQVSYPCPGGNTHVSIVLRAPIKEVVK